MQAPKPDLAAASIWILESIQLLQLPAPAFFVEAFVGSVGCDLSFSSTSLDAFFVRVTLGFAFRCSAANFS